MTATPDSASVATTVPAADSTFRPTIWDALRDLWDREKWRLLGACNRHDSSLWYSSRQSERTRAMEICSSCPVRVNCLDSALKEGESWAIRGGVDFGAPRRVSRAEYVKRGRKPKNEAG